MGFGAQEVRDWVRDPARADNDPAALADAYCRFEFAGGTEFFRDASGVEAYRMLASAARVSGAFAFLVLQTYVAHPHVGAVEHPSRTGVAFGHLRNPDPKASPRLNPSGRIAGTLPWFTGARVFSQVVLGWNDANGDEVRALVDATNRLEFEHSERMDLIAMSATHTVSVKLDLVPPDHILDRQPAGTMAANDRQGYIWQTPLMAGLLQASSDLVPSLAASAEPLLERLERAVQHGVEASTGRRLRSEAGEACVRLSRLAAMTLGGVALQRGHPAERIYRESLVVNLMARTPDLIDDAMAWEFR